MTRTLKHMFVVAAFLVIATGVYAQACCTSGIQGDQNCDGKLTLVDFEVWRREFTGQGNVTPTSTAPTATPTSAPTSNVKPAGNVPGAFNLAFQDEFDGSNIDATIWNFGTPWGGQFSQGEEYFTNTDYSVGGGLLNIQYNKRPTPIDDQGITRTYNTVMLQSKGKLAVHSGQYIEWRLKPARGNGFWSIAWIMPNSWPDNACPVQQYEMDVFEHLGRGNADTLATTTHVRGSCSSLSTDGGAGLAPSIDHSQAFHTAGVNWFTDHTDIYIDGNKVFTSSKFNGHDEPGFLMMNGFLGRAGDNWAGPSDSTTPTTANFQIDYVRVWNRQ